MLPLQRDLTSILAILAAFAISAAAYDSLPSHIPVHWGISGSIDRELHKQLGVVVYPAAMALVYVFFLLIPLADRNRVGQLREIGIYNLLRSGAVFLFGYGHVLAVGIGLGWVSRGANYLVGAAAILMALWSDYAQQNRPAWLEDLLRRRGRGASIENLVRALKIATVVALLGTLTGRWQPLWLAAPLLAAFAYTIRRAPRAQP